MVIISLNLKSIYLYLQIVDLRHKDPESEIKEEGI